jgi:hypothetical protein
VEEEARPSILFDILEGGRKSCVQNIVNAAYKKM